MDTLILKFARHDDDAYGQIHCLYVDHTGREVYISLSTEDATLEEIRMADAQAEYERRESMNTDVTNRVTLLDAWYDGGEHGDDMFYATYMDTAGRIYKVHDNLQYMSKEEQVLADYNVFEEMIIEDE